MPGRTRRLPPVFNFSGSEMIFLLLLALIILGPEKLPDAVRKFGKTYAEFKKVTTGFQQEFRQALDEPIREMRETADALKQAATFDDSVPEPAPKARSGSMAAVTPTPTDPTHADPAPADPTHADPTQDSGTPAAASPVDGASAPAEERPVPRAVQPPFAQPTSWGTAAPPVRPATGASAEPSSEDTPLTPGQEESTT